MLTPLFYRRFIFLLGWMAFGVATQCSGNTCISLAVLSFICTVTEVALGKIFGEDAQPLIPQVRLPKVQLPTVRLPALPPLPKGARALLLGATALGVFVGLPPLIRHFYPAFNAFGPDTLNAYTLGACQFFTALTMSYAAWRLLFPSLYAYAAETMEGKLLESITSELLKFMPQRGSFDYSEAVNALAERRKIATLTFTVRCARFAFSISPFVFFFVQANHALTSALTVVPPSAAGL